MSDRKAETPRKRVDVGDQDSPEVRDIRALGAGEHKIGDQHVVVTGSGKVLQD
ncbi:MAG: hypothetical protein RLZZ416_614 [Candidatus Parcubacteria bacterium]